MKESNQIFTSMDEKFMQHALNLAKQAYILNEVPVGAVLVKDQKIIATSHNLVESKNNATKHAEIICIEEASKYLNNWRLVGCALYTTLEPCVMCAGALISSRVSKVVWAAPDIRQGANGSLLNVFNDHPIHKVEIYGGLCQAESSKLLKEFFQKRRKDKEKCRAETISRYDRTTKEETSSCC